MATDIRVVFFDIGNVLLRYDPAASARRIARRLDRPVRAVEAFLESSPLTSRIEMGEFSAPQIRRLFCEKLQVDCDEALFRHLWNSHFRLIPQSAALLRLASRRCKTFLFSNTNPVHFEHIRRRYRFPSDAHGWLLSYRLGCRKPQPAIYARALAVAKAPADRCVFIDDRAENVAEAARAGMIALRFKGPLRLAAQLRRLGVV